MASNPLPIDNELISMLDRFRQEALLGSVPALQELTSAYGRLYTSLELRLEVILNRIWNNGGDVVSQAYVSSQLRELTAEIETELTRYQAYLQTVIDNEIEKNLKLGGGQSAELLKRFAGGVDLTLLNLGDPSVLNTMIGLLSWRGTVFAQVQKLAGYYAPLVRDIMVEAIALGYGPGKTAGLIAPFLKKIKDQFKTAMARPYADALRMTRTAQLWAAREATRQNYRASEIVTGWIWFARLDNRVCMSCVSLHGTVHTLDEILNDHWNGRCLVPGTMVSSPSITAFVSRRYDGEVISIRTESGKFLTVTPNHPVLTEFGWMPARLLQKGYKIVSDGGGDGATFGVNPNENHMPTVIEDIPAALGMERFAFVPSSTKNFHGDGMDADIHVIWTNGLLGNEIDPTIGQPVAEKFFSSRDAKPGLLAGPGYLRSMFGGMLEPSGEGLYYFDPLRFHTCGNFGHHEPVGVGLVTQFDTMINESSVNRSSRHAVPIGQSIDRFAGGVSGDSFIDGNREVEVLDHLLGDFPAGDLVPLGPISQHSLSLEFIRETLRTDVMRGGASLDAFQFDNIIMDGILDVSVGRFSGHVYNLQTKEGWYNSNGIITHNCAMLPIVRGEASQVKSGEEWFAALPPAQQKKLMGPGRYEAWMAGKFSFDQLSVEVEDPTYSTMRVEASLKSLIGDEK